MKMERLMIQLPTDMKADLDALKDEGYTVSSYIRQLLKLDLQARKDTGWVPGKGWIHRDKYLAASAAREEERKSRKLH